MKCVYSLIALLLVVREGISQDSGLMLYGKLGEFKGLPLSIRCEDKTGGYILIGGITVNNVPLDEQKQSQVKKNCEQQTKKNFERMLGGRKTVGRGKAKGTGCTLKIPGYKVADEDEIRVVYDCYDAKPAGAPAWGRKKNKNEEEVESKEVEGETDEQLMLACSKSSDMIFVTNAYINRVEADVTVHSSLDVETLTKICVEQLKQEVEKGPLRTGPSCYITNDASYNGKLSLEYECLNHNSPRKVKVGPKRGKGRPKNKANPTSGPPFRLNSSSGPPSKKPKEKGKPEKPKRGKEGKGGKLARE